MRKLLLVLFYSATVFSSLFTVAAFLHADWSEYMIPSALVFAASLFLLLRLLKPKERQASRARTRAVVDGSNVMHWQNGEPCFEPLQDVLGELKKLGFAPGVIFDANAGYLLVGKYQDDDKLAKRLKLPEDAVVVVSKGSSADPVILKAARELNGIVVTNDRFRDWVEDFPEIHRPGFLIRGGYKAGNLWLDRKISMAQKTDSPT
ncbi:NYN domain-containing protein [Aliiroseovarius sp. S253]|uniref:NYN domain-containing protein n=1 Tax=Aliiroseovarius sp. S253 TaxID=3415133 RepID=UPI003C7E3B1A